MEDKKELISLIQKMNTEELGRFLVGWIKARDPALCKTEEPQRTYDVVIHECDDLTALEWNDMLRVDDMAEQDAWDFARLMFKYKKNVLFIPGEE